MPQANFSRDDRPLRPGHSLASVVELINKSCDPVSVRAQAEEIMLRVAIEHCCPPEQQAEIQRFVMVHACDLFPGWFPHYEKQAGGPRWGLKIDGSVESIPGGV